MLTADLIRPSFRGGVMRVKPLEGDRRRRALELAAWLLEITREHIGRTRGELEEALALEVEARQRPLLLGLKKLLEDRCTFESAPSVDPAGLRREVFTRAAAARRQGGLRDSDRQQVIEHSAALVGIAPHEVERALFADLRAAHVLTTVDATSAKELVERYDLSQAQAVLLRAERVEARIRCTDPAAYRALFARLKFLQLLFVVDPLDDGYQILIDGPFSLFSSSTRYGLKLALALPVLAACDACEVRADVRWGKDKKPRVFVWDKGDAPSFASTVEGTVRDDVRALLEGIASIPERSWEAETCAEILHVPGAGLCVPDVVFTNRRTGEQVYLEVMGFWSRDAVWRRVELVEKGLAARVVFAVSNRLRVSERAVDKEHPSALYVYKGVMSARAVLERVEAVSAR